MIFSSPEFIFLFLPIVFAVYFLLNKLRVPYASKTWLVLASLYFYSYWSLDYLPLMLGSIAFNYTLGIMLARQSSRRNLYLTIGVIANLLTLGYYKYANFFLDNLNVLLDKNMHIAEHVLPIGISFYTFTQIAFLVDSYKGKVKEFDIINYTLFVTFFPHLIAGPILHHKEMMDQFRSKWTFFIRYKNILMGMMIFGIGLFKKTMLADVFAIWANAGFAPGVEHDFYSAWVTSLSYTFQLYFDFSGYCDMAIGAALLFNIWLPINFNSPYKSLDIQDFWRRWHITLGRYLRDYLYIPLGGNRCAVPRMYFNLFITFVLGGLWHGASWMFVIWGVMHGGALVAHRMWKNANMEMPNAIAWLVTFLYVDLAWVFFRAHSMDDAMRIIKAMFTLPGSPAMNTMAIENMSFMGTMADSISRFMPDGVAIYAAPIVMAAIGFAICAQKNSIEIVATGEITKRKMMFVGIISLLGLYMVLHTTSAVFLYFNF
ncbi:MBOAT family O-acyltransferase [Cronobacter turicensis]